MFKKILVALDHSPMARSLFEQALLLAQEQHASLVLVHVISMEDEAMYGTDPLYVNPIYGAPGPTIGAEVWYEQWQLFRNRCLEQLQNFAAQATQAGVETECTQVTGSPGKMICHLASLSGADLILVGSRGRSGISEMLLGSVSNYVLHHAPCSVLVIKSPVEEKHSEPAKDYQLKMNK
ncbi:MAG TPA: universal stress protein [Coleofasciculaceae cyanobacterium]